MLPQAGAPYGGSKHSTSAVLDAWADAHWKAAHPTAERVSVVRVMR